MNILGGCLKVSFQWSRILRLPDTILFSSTAPAGMSILSPWLAMMITVPRRLTEIYMSYVIRETQCHKLTSASKSDVPGNGKVIQLKQIRNGAESREKRGDFFKLSVAKLD